MIWLVVWFTDFLEMGTYQLNPIVIVVLFYLKKTCTAVINPSSLYGSTNELPKREITNLDWFVSSVYYSSLDCTASVADYSNYIRLNLCQSNGADGAVKYSATYQDVDQNIIELKKTFYIDSFCFFTDSIEVTMYENACITTGSANSAQWSLVSQVTYPPNAIIRRWACAVAGE